MRSTPKQVLMGATGAVVASTAFLPSVTGYGTALYQAVALASWAIVARLVSSRFADQHDAVVWLVAIVVNGLFFFLPAWIAYAATRKKWPRGGIAILIAWCLFYLVSLFWLFPSSDGP
jgi:phosphotransferase system  glucose/maltose/N-acetylglucosamine-specific IIC component